jgi:proteasome lid subunit RPN8/RPN11
MLKIPQHIYDDMLAHAEQGFPLEVCGILGGREGTVSANYRMTNTDQSNEHFMMDPREQFAVAKELRSQGLEMTAVYHSHPETPARPSEEDIRLALTPGISHVIVSLAGAGTPVARSYRITDGTVAAEDLLVVP